MPQLQLYVSDEVAAKLREQASARNMSLSRYLTEIVQRETQVGWPEGYFEEVVGSWMGEPLERPEPFEREERDSL